ncbi:MAG: S41 family peptidase [Proteobacteria bacterium]|nr:S41 family peptidase [Pseudomonadota bacterium]
MLKSIARRAFLPLAFTAFVSLGAVADDGGKSAPAAPDATPGVAPEQSEDSNTGKATATAVEPIPVDDIRVLVEVLHKIKSDYVEAIDDKTLIENAMRGMLSGLDPHSAYLDADDYTDLQEGTSGEFGGLGIEVGMEEGFVKVISPIDDTPAQQAGVQAGDTIIKLDDTLVKGMSINDAVKKMRGKPGSDITLTILREGEQKPLTFKLTRALIKVASVRSRLLEPGYGYIRVSQFQAATGEDVIKQLGELKAKSGDKLNGLILDLRNNPGGILGAAVSISDAFLESGKIVYTDGRVADSKLEFSAKPPDMLNGAPLIVLINEGSASASEIVAGALQDRGRALIMGRRSFGKGSVQTILPMNNRSALKLTTARYFTPNGRSIQAEGIKPDIVIDKVKVSSIKSAGADTIKEADLSRHLANPVTDKGKAAPAEAANGGKQSNGDKDDDADKGPLAERDYELYEAFNMLKGMVMLNSKRNVAAP